MRRGGAARIRRLLGLECGDLRALFRELLALLRVLLGSGLRVLLGSGLLVGARGAYVRCGADHGGCHE